MAESASKSRGYNLKCGCLAGCGAIFYTTRTWIDESEAYPDPPAKAVTMMRRALKAALDALGVAELPPTFPGSEVRKHAEEALDLTASNAGLICPVCGGPAAEGDPSDRKPIDVVAGVAAYFEGREPQIEATATAINTHIEMRHPKRRRRPRRQS